MKSKLLLAAALAVTLTACAGAPDQPSPALQAAVSSPSRTPANSARDTYRHPAETLAFFGLRENMSVIEIWPAGGWWTEILAPYLAANGAYFAAEAQSDYARPGRDAMAARIAADPARYGKIRRVVFDADGKDIVPPGTADMVLVFRSLHNWMAQGTTEMNLATINRALKPGGVLGIEGHRGDPGQPQDPKAKSGYVREDAAIALIEAAGFKFAGKSEINANPRDTKDYPEGVWTLPPTYRMKEKDKDRYTAIGESDRFTLKFVKVR